MIRVLIADDQPSVRQGMRSLVEFEDDLEVVGEAADGQHAVELAQRRNADVVVMDIRMPRMDGLAATRRLVTAGAEPDVSVLVVTTFDLDEYVFAALKAGAAGFLLKSDAADTLVPAIRAVAAGQGLISQEVTRRLIQEFASVSPPVHPDAAFAELTAREHEILLYVTRGLSNAEIAATLVVEESTVKSHVTSMLAKLGLRSRVQAVIYAYEQGIVRVGRTPR